MAITKLKLERLQSGKKQITLAVETGIHQCIISLIEQGHMAPNDKQKKAIAKALNIPEKNLFPEK